MFRQSFPKHLAECPEFDLIAYAGSGSMCLDQSDRAGDAVQRDEAAEAGPFRFR